MQAEKEKALVSVIVPVYKVEPYLRECLDSIITQTYTNLEIILVDDGSPDNSGQICEDYARKDSRITVYHKENGGQAEARNYALDRCNGEYITFTDSDDIMKNNLVEAHMSLAEKYGADITLSPNRKFHELLTWGGGTRQESDSEEGCIPVHEALENLLYQNRIFRAGPFNKIHRRAVFNGIRFPVGLIYEDLGTTYRTYFNCKMLAFTTEELYGYRIYGGSTMRQAYTPKMLSCIEISRQLYRDISERYPDLEAAAASRAFSVNRCVYFQLPRERKEERLKVWDEMAKYRKTVISDPKARKRERLAALLSYAGPGAFHLLSGLYRRWQMRA